MLKECGSLAAWKMEAGPPDADCRISPQTARRCLGIRSQVVNGPGKGEKNSSGVYWSAWRILYRMR